MPSYTTELLERICDKLEIEYGGLKAAAKHAADKRAERAKADQAELRAKWEAIDKVHEQNRKEREEHLAELQELLAKPLPSQRKPEPLTPDQRAQVELRYIEASRRMNAALNELSDCGENANPLYEKKLSDKYNAAVAEVVELERQLDAGQ